jgi:hypothetical protein
MVFLEVNYGALPCQANMVIQKSVPYSHVARVLWSGVQSLHGQGEKGELTATRAGGLLISRVLWCWLRAAWSRWGCAEVGRCPHFDIGHPSSAI